MLYVKSPLPGWGHHLNSVDRGVHTIDLSRQKQTISVDRETRGRRNLRLTTPFIKLNAEDIQPSNTLIHLSLFLTCSSSSCCFFWQATSAACVAAKVLSLFWSTSASLRCTSSRHWAMSRDVFSLFRALLVLS